MMRPDEREVFYLFAEGTSVREISAILGIDEITAEYYRATVYRKMDVATILDLTVLATILGLAQTAASVRPASILTTRRRPRDKRLRCV